jgi:chorismate mutase
MKFQFLLIYLFFLPSTFSFILSREFRIKLIRKNIDFIDNQIYHYLSLRLKLSEDISYVKDDKEFFIFDTKREKEIIDRLKNKNLIRDDEFIENIWSFIFQKSKQIQYENYNR